MSDTSQPVTHIVLKGQWRTKEEETFIEKMKEGR